MANSNNRKSGRISRRKVLQSTAIAGAAAVSIDVSSSIGSANPDPEDFVLGEALFLEVKEEYPEIKGQDIDLVEHCQYPVSKYTIQPDQNRLLLSTVIGDSFSASETIVAAENTLYDGEKPFPLSRSKYFLPVETDYNHRNASYVKGSSEQDLITIPAEGAAKNDMKMPSSRVARVSHSAGQPSVVSEHLSTTVPRGEELVTRGPKINAKLENHGSEMLSQRVSFRNHGRVKIFGHPNYDIIPSDPKSKMSSRNLRLVKEVAPDQLVQFEGGELVAVPKDLEITISEGGDDE